MSDGADRWGIAPDAELDVIGLGENSLDLVCMLEPGATLPGPGGKARLASQSIRPGGQVATTMLGCARLGLRAILSGSLATFMTGCVAGILI